MDLQHKSKIKDSRITFGDREINAKDIYVDFQQEFSENADGEQEINRETFKIEFKCDQMIPVDMVGELIVHGDNPLTLYNAEVYFVGWDEKQKIKHYIMNALPKNDGRLGSLQAQSK